MSDQNDDVRVTLETTAGAMTFEFFPDRAPSHVANFVKLAEQGFYDGTVFHRTIPGFMIQGGCPDGTGMGGPGYSIDAEFNDVKHVRGSLSMARSSDPNSAGSQFFVCHAEASFLDNQYTNFGRLVEGEDALDAIATAPTHPGGEGSKPVDPVKITKATVTRGVTS
jgi:peptidyl-prolyl cis-trans isomerase B (cyclophilin B)